MREKTIVAAPLSSQCDHAAERARTFRDLRGKQESVSAVAHEL